MKRFRHVLDRHGLWAEVRRTPPRNTFGPLVNLGLIQVAMAWREDARVRRFVREASRAELATFICLLAALGEDVMDIPLPEFVSQIADNRRPTPTGAQRPNE